jgi:FixJ family two-component response regulator
LREINALAERIHHRDAMGPSYEVNIAPPTVVIVEDDTAVLNSLRFAFEIEGFAVQTFQSAEAALGSDLPRQGCMILDYRLPMMNGLELVARLRERGFSQPVILITSDPGPRVRQEAAARGVGIVEKPLLGSSLIDLVRSAIDRPRPNSHSDRPLA